MCCCCCKVASVASDSVQPHIWQPTRLCHPWDSPGKNTGVGCHCLLQCMKMKSESEVAQSCPTLHDPMDCSLPGSSVHGTSQARVLEWVAIAFSNGCESWTIKKTECWRIDAFELWCWRRLLRVPWTARRSNQSILMEISLGVHWKDWCWSWNSHTLATWGQELTHWKRLWCWERLRAGGEGDNRGWDGWMASSTRWTWVWVDSGSWWWTGGLACCGSWGGKESDPTEQLNWTGLNKNSAYINFAKLHCTTFSRCTTSSLRMAIVIKG